MVVLLQLMRQGVLMLNNEQKIGEIIDPDNAVPELISRKEK